MFGAGRQIEPFSRRFPEFDIADAYRVMRRLRALHETRGEHAVGRKIGFTNRGIWDEFNIATPIWGYMYDSTVHELADVAGGFSLTGLVEARIEPEIVLGLRAAPHDRMTEPELLGCVEWIALGFEIVQSIYPDWRFTAAEAIAGHAMHASLLIGPRRPAGADSHAWLDTLSSFRLDLIRDGELVAEGGGADVLGGPLSALRYLAETLASDRENPPLAAGEIVTTGTLTQAPRIAPGEAWRAIPHGVALGAIDVRLT